MKRDIKHLQQSVFDLLVIGGGIYGACTAWDAARRGLSVAIVDKGDFGHATSANSLKIIHGGLRYFQDGNLSLARSMIRERRAFMQIAPHLVHPLPCILPTYKRLDRNKIFLAVAFLINDLLGYDRNRNQPDSNKHLPSGKIVSKEKLRSWFPGGVDKDVTGGAQWYDAQVFNTERLTLSFILSAVQRGTIAANYVEAVELLQEDRRIVGIKGKDLLSDSTFEIHARVVANATGPWSNELLRDLVGSQWQSRFRPSLALNLVTRQIMPNLAVGIESRKNVSDENGNQRNKRQTLFITPWRNFSLIGTKHQPVDRENGDMLVSNKLIQDFLDDINMAVPGAELKIDDVYLVHQGFLPDESENGSAEVKLVRRNQILDHVKDNVEGLITIIGVKYTLARQAAEETVDLVFQKLGRTAPPCETTNIPIYGGNIKNLEQYIDRETASHGHLLSQDTLRHLVYNYGTAYSDVTKYLDESMEWAEPLCLDSDVLKAEVVHGIRSEMAMKLGDIILRRTELGTAGKPSETSIEECAQIMAAELGWDRSRINKEMEELQTYYSSRILK